VIKKLEYDPNRTCLLALVENVKSKEIHYTLGTQEIEEGHFLSSINTYVYQDQEGNLKENKKPGQKHGSQVSSLSNTAVET
jgi:ribosomal protein L2